MQNASCGCFWKYLLNFFFIAYENDEWCHIVVPIDPPTLISFYCVCFVSFYFFLFLFCGFYYLLKYWGYLSILKTKQWSRSEVSKWGFAGDLLQPYLIINVNDLVKFEKNLCYILPPLSSPWNWYINFYIELMVICSIDALKNLWRRKKQ